MSDEYVEPPYVSSTLEWKDVTLPPGLSVDELDEAIFAVLKPNWRKTAMIIIQSSKFLALRSVEVDPEVVGASLDALARAGRIDSAGDLFKWRHSEVRLKDAHEPKGVDVRESADT